MADPYPDYDPDEYATVPGNVTQAPIVVSSKKGRSMGSVEIGVIAVAVAVAILTLSAVVSLSKRP